MTISIDRLRREAKALKADFSAGDADAAARVHAVFPGADAMKRADALHVLAREQGFKSWPKLKLAAEIIGMDRAARADRLKIALFYGQDWQVSQLLASDPELWSENFGLKVAIYRIDEVRADLERDPEIVHRKVGPRLPILHLAFSQHWRSLPDGAAKSVAMAELLVAAGADVNDSYPAEPGSEHGLSVLYGALGHAGNMELARWLLEQGADPNDNESLYHATELGHADGLRLLLAHGAQTKGTNALLRAMDFDNLEMVEVLLEAGADPNEGVGDHPSGQPATVIPGLHQAARRMGSAEIAEALIAHGADGTTIYNGHTAYAIARMRGNHAVARVMEAHGQDTPLEEVERLLARVAEGRPVDARIDWGGLSDEASRLVHRLLGFEDTLDHVKRLIDIGYDPNWVDEQDMPAIHVAGWHGLAEAVEYLLGWNPDLEVKNMYGGDLMGTIIHGAEFCPDRDRRDYQRAALAALGAGSKLHQYDVDHCGVEDLASLLQDWAEAHPEQVIPRN